MPLKADNRMAFVNQHIHHFLFPAFFFRSAGGILTDPASCHLQALADASYRLVMTGVDH